MIGVALILWSKDSDAHCLSLPKNFSEGIIKNLYVNCIVLLLLSNALIRSNKH